MVALGTRAVPAHLLLTAACNQLSRVTAKRPADGAHGGWVVTWRRPLATSHPLSLPLQHLGSGVRPLTSFDLLPGERQGVLAGVPGAESQGCCPILDWPLTSPGGGGLISECLRSSLKADKGKTLPQVFLAEGGPVIFPHFFVEGCGL